MLWVKSKAHPIPKKVRVPKPLMKWLITVKKLFSRNGWTLKDEKYYPSSFGNYFLDFSITGLLARVENDRGVEYIMISSKNDPANRQDLGALKALILGDETFLMESPTIDAQADFLFSYVEDIRRLFCKGNYEQSLRKLGDLRSVRGKLLFSDFDKGGYI